MPILNEVMRSHPPAAETPVPVSKVAPAATTSAAPRELNADSSSIEVFAIQVLKVVASYHAGVSKSSKNGVFIKLIFEVLIFYKDAKLSFKKKVVFL